MSFITRYRIILIVLAALIPVVGIIAERTLSSADARFYRGIAALSGQPPGTRPQLHRPGEAVRMEKCILRKHTRQYPTISLITWETDARADQTALPLPRLKELATIVNCLVQRRGASCVGISAPLLWEDSRDEIAHHMLQHALQGSRTTICLGLAGRNAAQAETLPPQLLPAAIPPAQVQGDPAGLPYANAPLPFTPPATGDTPLLWAPDYVEDSPGTRAAQEVRGLSCPLLLRWRGEVLPTLPLRMALSRLGLSPADVHVRMGKSIRIGKRLLPLDARGRTPLGAARVSPLPLADVLSTRPEQQDAPLVIINRDFTPDQPAGRGEQLAATLSLLLSADSETYLPTMRPEGGMLLEQAAIQRTLGGRIILVALIAGLLVWLPTRTRRERRLTLGALAPVGIISAVICYHCGAWVSLSAGVLTWGLLFGGTELLARLRGGKKLL